MATWFATNNGNINTAGRWNSLPDGTGSTLTWPPASGDVLVANGKSITINVDFNLGSTGELRNDTTGGATNNGNFAFSTSRTITTKLVLGASASSHLTICSTNGVTINIIGNVEVYGPSRAFYCNSTATWNIIGTFTQTGNGACSVANGSLNFTGDILFNPIAAGSQAIAFAFSNAYSSTITGNINAACNSSNTIAIACSATAGSLTVTGNVTQTGTGTLANNYAVSVTGTAPVTVTGYAQASNTIPALNNAAQAVLTVGETRSASNGRGAVYGAFRYASATALVHKPIVADGSTLTMKPVSAFTLPAENTVRRGVAFGADKVGTLAGANRHHRMGL